MKKLSQAARRSCRIVGRTSIRKEGLSFFPLKTLLVKLFSGGLRKMHLLCSVRFHFHAATGICSGSSAGELVFYSRASEWIRWNRRRAVGWGPLFHQAVSGHTHSHTPRLVVFYFPALARLLFSLGSCHHAVQPLLLHAGLSHSESSPLGLHAQ